jgi:hypothetical protein
MSVHLIEEDGIARVVCVDDDESERRLVAIRSKPISDVDRAWNAYVHTHYRPFCTTCMECGGSPSQFCGCAKARWIERYNKTH